MLQALAVCELLALSTSQRVRLTFSLHTLASRSGMDGNMHDGWGVAFYQGDDVALFREPRAAEGSALVNYLETGGPSTNTVISHIRHATRGAVHYANTQPFIRELGGRTHAFAHNGDLPNIETSKALALRDHRPVGQTDSEYAFCVLLGRLRTLWDESSPPSLAARFTALESFADDLRSLGPANFIYADSDALFVHGHRRRQVNGGQVEPPGLWLLQRHCAPIDPTPTHETGVSISQQARVSLFIASVPLTDEAWRPLADGELIAVRAGEVLIVRTPNLG